MVIDKTPSLLLTNNIMRHSTPLIHHSRHTIKPIEEISFITVQQQRFSLHIRDFI